MNRKGGTEREEGLTRENGEGKGSRFGMCPWVNHRLVILNTHTHTQLFQLYSDLIRPWIKLHHFHSSLIISVIHTNIQYMVYLTTHTHTHTSSLSCSHTHTPQVVSLSLKCTLCRALLVLAARQDGRLTTHTPHIHVLTRSISAPALPLLFFQSCRGGEVRGHQFSLDWWCPWLTPLLRRSEESFVSHLINYCPSLRTIKAICSFNPSSWCMTKLISFLKHHSTK